MSDVVLDVRNLSVEFPTRRGTLTAVDDISLQIRRGEILGMVGESGAGKSMTGMAILGLLEPPGPAHLAEPAVSRRGPVERDNPPSYEPRQATGARTRKRADARGRDSGGRGAD